LQNSFEGSFLTIGKGSKKGKEGKNNKKTLFVIFALFALFASLRPSSDLWRGLISRHRKTST